MGWEMQPHGSPVRHYQQIEDKEVKEINTDEA